MEFIKVKNIHPNGQIFVWKIEETLNELLNKTYLTPKDKESLNTITHENRKKEYLSTRLALQKVIDKKVRINYKQSGKPYLQNSLYNISISHKNNYVAIFLAQNLEIAIDIEKISDKLIKIQDKFLSPQEAEKIFTKNRLQYLTLIWSAKECMYKLMEKDLKFKTDMYIFPINLKKNYFYGSIKPHYKNKIKLYYEYVDLDLHLLMVWTYLK